MPNLSLNLRVKYHCQNFWGLIKGKRGDKLSFFFLQNFYGATSSFECMSHLQSHSNTMLLKKLWPFFHSRQLQNSVHYKAYCKGCVSYHLVQAKVLKEVDDLDSLDPTKKLFKDREHFAAGMVPIHSGPHQN